MQARHFLTHIDEAEGWIRANKRFLHEHPNMEQRIRDAVQANIRIHEGMRDTAYKALVAIYTLKPIEKILEEITA